MGIKNYFVSKPKLNKRHDKKRIKQLQTARRKIAMDKTINESDRERALYSLDTKISAIEDKYKRI